MKLTKMNLNTTGRHQLLSVVLERSMLNRGHSQLLSMSKFLYSLIYETNA